MCRKLRRFRASNRNIVLSHGRRTAREATMKMTGNKVVTRVTTSALDDVPMGIVRITRDRRIGHMNTAARAMLGGQVKVGTALADIPMDPKSRRTLKAMLEARQDGLGSTYELNLLDERWGTRTLLEVTGVPEHDEDGNVIGSLGFLRNRSFEAANVGIHDAIEESATWESLLKRVAGELHQVIAYDSFLVTLVSDGRRHLRALYEDPPYRKASPIRWWPMPEFVRLMLKGLTKPSQLDVDQMFSEPGFREMALSDPSTVDWRTRKFKYLLRRPVFHKGVLVAIVMLQRVAPEPFTQADLKTFSELPVAEAIEIALALDKRGEMQFRLDLIRDLGVRANNAKALREHLVQRLRDNYAWEHVSLYRLDEDHKLMRLECQSADPGKALPVGDSQPYASGLLGAVRKTKRAVVVGDVEKDPRYVQGIEGTLSEMCLPVPGSRLRWILNVESSQKDAFADEEQQSVEILLGVVGFLLDRVEMIEMKSAIFESVADGVILTSIDGEIQQVNPAFANMLDRKPEDFLGEKLQDYIFPADGKDSAGYGSRQVARDEMESMRVELRRKTTKVPVLLSGATLPQGLGGKVYVASDLRFSEKLEQMQALKRVFSSIAAEMRIPLSLACSFVNEMPNDNEDVNDLRDKAVAQLRKADLPLERILRLSNLGNEEALATADIDLQGVLEKITSDLPSSQANEVRLRVPSGVRPAKAAYSELSFCMQSIVAFLLRQKAQADELRIDVSQGAKRTAVDFWLAKEHTTLASPTEIPPLDRNVREFALADGLIASLMGRMGGRYEPRDPEKLRFRLSLGSQGERP
jgi:PAS domain S-box-containing protein